MLQRHSQIADYRLSDRFERSEGRVFLTGTQALARIMFDQARRDRDQGLNTAGFVSGYRGSPLGGLDLELWRNRAKLKQDRITFMPAVNEDLGATAVLGAQQAVLDPAVAEKIYFKSETLMNSLEEPASESKNKFAPDADEKPIKGSGWRPDQY